MKSIGRFIEGGAIIRMSDGACIPNDPSNRDYQEMMAAAELGQTIDPYVPPEQEPEPSDDEKLDRLFSIVGLDPTKGRALLRTKA